MGTEHRSTIEIKWNPSGTKYWMRYSEWGQSGKGIQRNRTTPSFPTSLSRKKSSEAGRQGCSAGCSPALREWETCSPPENSSGNIHSIKNRFTFKPSNPSSWTLSHENKNMKIYAPDTHFMMNYGGKAGEKVRAIDRTMVE